MSFRRRKWNRAAHRAGLSLDLSAKVELPFTGHSRLDLETVEAGLIGMADLVRLLATGPARIFGLYPRKGRLSAGADADVVLFDPRASGTLRDEDLHSAAGFSPYSGLELKGRVRTTICRGRVVYDQGKVSGEPGWGQFIERTPFDATHLP